MFWKNNWHKQNPKELREALYFFEFTDGFLANSTFQMCTTELILCRRLFYIIFLTTLFYIFFALNRHLEYIFFEKRVNVTGIIDVKQRIYWHINVKIVPDDVNINQKMKIEINSVFPIRSVITPICFHKS